MTMKYTATTKEARRRPAFIPKPPPANFIPDPPKEAEELNSYYHVAVSVNMHRLILHFDSPETTIIKAGRYLQAEPLAMPSAQRIPDLLIAFDTDPELMHKSLNCYIISEQGKHPDFVLNVATRGTLRRDLWGSREDYQAMGIPEYWRFDETGEYYGEGLAGDLLVEGEYRSIDIEMLEEGVLQGYSPALKLHIRWEHGGLKFQDPETGQCIPTTRPERQRRLRAEQERRAAEARVRELEGLLRQRDAGRE